MRLLGSKREKQTIKTPLKAMLKHESLKINNYLGKPSKKKEKKSMEFSIPGGGGWWGPSGVAKALLEQK